MLIADPVNHQSSAGSYFVGEEYRLFILASIQNTGGEVDSTVHSRHTCKSDQKNTRYFPFSAIKQKN